MSDTLFSTGPVAPADAAPDLSAAIRAIAARCDGAQDHDGVGFNGQDTHFGRALAMVPAEKWTPEVTVEAHRTLRKYRGQLASAGIDYDALPVPEGAAAENATANRDARSDAYAMRRDATSADARKIRLDGQRLIIEFPYDQKRVAAVKQIPGARWDGAAKVWTIPIESGRAAVDTFPDFHIGEGILEAVEHAPPPPPARRIEGDGRRYLVWFPYDGRLVDLMRGVPGARWDKELGCWGVGVSPVAAAALRPLIDEGFEDLAGLSAEAEPVAAMVELSRAQDLDGFEVPGLRREPYPYQRAGIAYAAAARRTFIADEMGLGKALAVSAPISVPGGWRKIGDLAVGDQVTGSDGRSTTVVGVYPQGVKDLARITFSDGTAVEADWEHLWSVSHIRNDTPARYPDTGGRARVMTTREILDAGLADKAGNRNWKIPLVAPVEHPEVEVPLDPYALGVWLGDGSSNGRRASLGLNLEDLPGIAESVRIQGRIRIEGGGASVGLPCAVDGLEELGLLGKRSWEKFVPEPYLTGSIEQRLALLQGLMDTDGSAVRDGGGTEFSSTSEALVDAVVELAQSLGGVGRKKGHRSTTYMHNGEKRTGRPSWRVNVKLPPQFEPFRVPRKLDTWIRPTKYPPARAIVSIEDAGRSEEAVCIAVDAPDHLYVMEHYVVTHNTAQALGTIEAVQMYPALVVCPVKIRTNWAREAEAWLPEGKRIAVVVPPSTPRDEQARMAAAGFMPLLGQPRPGFDIYITGYPLLHTQVEAWAGVGLKGLVLDESHYCKGRDKVGVCPACGSEMTRKGVCKGPEEHVASKRQQRKVYKVLWTRAAKAISETIPRDGVVLALSGTPNKNTPQDFVAQLDILGRLDDFGGEWHFLTRWCGAYRDSWGWRTDGASNLAELNERLRSTCYIRRAKADVLPDLPALDRREGRVELDTTDMAEYRRIEADFLSFIAQRAAELAEEEGEDPSSAAWEARLRAEAAEHLVRITTLRRSAAAAKIGIAKEWVEQFLDETDRKLIVFAHHREVVEALANEFDCERIDGGTSDSMGAVDRFQNDPNVRVIVIGIMAGGVGLTLTAASDMLFIEQAWTPADLDQAEARAYGRVNDAHGATATYLLADGTIDDDMWELIGEKRVVFHAAADGEAMAPSKKRSVTGDLLVRMARRALANAPEA